MKNIPITYWIAVMIPLISPFIKDSHFCLKHLLNVCKRLKAKVSKRLINEYNRLVEDSNIASQRFMKFGNIAAMGEVRI